MTAANQKHSSISWTASEYIDHSRGAGWYLTLGVVTAILAVVFYFLLDRVAPFMVIVLGVIVGFSAGRKPRDISYTLSPQGFTAGERFYNYGEFKSFSIIHEGLLSSLLLTPLKRFAPPVSVYFESADEDAIVQIINEHLPIEQRGPDKIDTLSRRLRF